MGKKGGKPKIEVTEYFLSQHFGICMGQPDALQKIIIDEKEAWTGDQTEAGDISINAPELFGGIKREGGAIGIARFLPGAADQLLTDALAQKLGRINAAETPGFRGFASLFFSGSITGRGFYWRANSPFLPGVWTKLQRILKRADGSEQWYSEKASIDSCGGGAEFALDTADWRYLVGADPGNETTIDELPSPTYEAPSFDDSGWSQDVMPFGNIDWSTTGSGVTKPSEFGFRDATNEVWPFHRIIHLRRTFTLDQAASAVIFDAFVDNGWEMWVNGEKVFTDPVPTASNRTTQSVPGSFFNVGENLIYIRASDTYSGASGNRCAIDIRYRNAGPSLDMNPAHIIHECLTDRTWGMGTPLAALDDASFRAAADTLFDENFGLSLMWVRQSSIEDFVQEILDHINGVIFTDPSTGLLTLALIRDDYDPESLPEINPDNADLTSYSRKLWGDIANEIIVTWTNPENEQEETITVQDDASISIQGGVVSESRNYYGVRCATLAMRLAYRDLRSSGQPLASCKAKVDRSQFALRPASVLKLTWPEYGISDLIMRVTSIDYGKPGNPEIEIDLVEDVFGLDIGSFDEPASSAWVDPSAAPTPFDEARIFTLPAYFAINSSIGEFVESPEYPEVVAGILVKSSNSDAYSYDLWDEVPLANGSTEWQRIAENNVTGFAELGDALGAEASSSGITFDNLIGGTSPIAGGFVLIGDGTEETDEIALIDTAGDTYSLIRGVLDTVPRAWPAGTEVAFLDESTLFEDPFVRSGGEEVDYRALMRTSRGTFDFDSASTFSKTLTDRPWLPNRPANVLAYDVAFSSQASPIDASARSDPWVTVEWAIRNRLEEDSVVLGWTDASMTPEAGQTTMIEVRDPDGNLITMHDGLSGTSFDVPDASFGSETIVELRIYSERSLDSLVLQSLQYFSHWVRVGSSLLELSGDATDGDDLLLLSGDEDGILIISGE